MGFKTLEVAGGFREERLGLLAIRVPVNRHREVAQVVSEQGQHHHKTGWQYNTPANRPPVPRDPRMAAACVPCGGSATVLSRAPGLSIPARYERALGHESCGCGWGSEGEGPAAVGLRARILTNGLWFVYRTSSRVNPFATRASHRTAGNE